MGGCCSTSSEYKTYARGENPETLTIQYRVAQQQQEQLQNQPQAQNQQSHSQGHPSSPNTATGSLPLNSPKTQPLPLTRETSLTPSIHADNATSSNTNANHIQTNQNANAQNKSNKSKTAKRNKNSKAQRNGKNNSSRSLAGTARNHSSHSIHSRVSSARSSKTRMSRQNSHLSAQTTGSLTGNLTYTTTNSNNALSALEQDRLLLEEMRREMEALKQRKAFLESIRDALAQIQVEDENESVDSEDEHEEYQTKFIKQLEGRLLKKMDNFDMRQFKRRSVQRVRKEKSEVTVRPKKDEANIDVPNVLDGEGTRAWNNQFAARLTLMRKFYDWDEIPLDFFVDKHVKVATPTPSHPDMKLRERLTARLSERRSLNSNRHDNRASIRSSLNRRRPPPHIGKNASRDRASRTRNTRETRGTKETRETSENRDTKNTRETRDGKPEKTATRETRGTRNSKERGGGPVARGRRSRERDRPREIEIDIEMSSSSSSDSDGDIAFRNSGSGDGGIVLGPMSPSMREGMEKFANANNKSKGPGRGYSTTSNNSDFVPI